MSTSIFILRYPYICIGILLPKRLPFSSEITYIFSAKSCHGDGCPRSVATMSVPCQLGKACEPRHGRPSQYLVTTALVFLSCQTHSFERGRFFVLCISHSGIFDFRIFCLGSMGIGGYPILLGVKFHMECIQNHVWPSLGPEI